MAVDGGGQRDCAVRAGLRGAVIEGVRQRLAAPRLQDLLRRALRRRVLYYHSHLSAQKLRFTISAFTRSSFLSITSSDITAANNDSQKRTIY